MADFSKVTVNGTTYNVKDATARTAASNAQTTANGKLSDAPSDGKEYVRKNGAWAEPSGGGGSGVPDGGTIGQVLAKRSGTDGDAGWYSLRHLPSDKWYLPTGILETDVIAAYQFVNRQDEAEALLNINDGVEYPLSKVLGTETWNTDKGFYIPGTQYAGLKNTNLLNQYTNILSAAFGFAGVSISSTNGVAGGIIMSTNRLLTIRGRNSSGMFNKPTINKNSISNNLMIHTNMLTSGVLAGNWLSDNNVMYHDGASLSLQEQSGTPNIPQLCVAGQEAASSLYPFYITALVLYNIALTASQHLELSDNIRALGGIN